MVWMVMRVDDVRDGKRRNLADFAEDFLAFSAIDAGINHQNIFRADQKRRICAAVVVGDVGVEIGTEGLDARPRRRGESERR